MHGRIWTTDTPCPECGNGSATLCDVDYNNVVTGQTVQCRKCDAYYDDPQLVVGESLADDARDAESGAR